MTEPETTARDPLAPTIDPLAGVDFAADTPPTTEPRPDLAEAPETTPQPPAESAPQVPPPPKDLSPLECARRINELAKAASLCCDIVEHYHDMIRQFQKAGHVLPPSLAYSQAVEACTIDYTRALALPFLPQSAN